MDLRSVHFAVELIQCDASFVSSVVPQSAEAFDGLVQNSP